MKNEKEIDLAELARVVFAQKKRLVRWGVVGFVIGIVIAFSIPNEYKAEVVIAPEAPKSNKGSMQSLGGLANMVGVDLPGAGQNADGLSEKVYPEIIKSKPFLLELSDIDVHFDGQQMSFYDYITSHQKRTWWSYMIDAPIQGVAWVFSLFSDTADTIVETNSVFKPSRKLMQYVGCLSDMIVFKSDAKRSVITITTTMQDPVIAALITDSLVSNLQRYMINYKTAKTRQNLTVSIEKLNDAKQAFYFADSIYASVVDRNQNLIAQSAKVKIERLQNERSLAFNIYQQLATQVELNKIELQENTSIATIIDPPSVPLKATSPKKLTLIIVFSFLGIFVAAAIIITKHLFKKQP